MIDITPENVARRVDALRRASGRFDILDCETALQVADVAESLSARLAEVEAEQEKTRRFLKISRKEGEDALIRSEAAETENAKLREALTLIERIYYLEEKDAEWKSARMNGIARDAHDGNDLGHYRRIFPRAAIQGATK